jgi:carbamoyltransferase
MQPNALMKNVAIYGYHDASLCLKDNGRYYIYEAERFFGKRYSILTQEFKNHPIVGHLVPSDSQFHAFFDHIKNKHKFETIENLYYHDMYPPDINKIKQFFHVQNFRSFNHHDAHAWSAYCQCPFDETYIITYDGNGKNLVGPESSFVLWYATPTEVKKLNDFQPWGSYSLGNCYIALTNCLASIKKKKNFGLPSAGKLMGLCSYGQPREAWKQVIREFFDSGSKDAAQGVANVVGFDPREYDTISGRDELDFAATIQWAFEDKFFGIFNDLNIPPNSNLCLAGGCALNIIVNQKLFEMGYNVYVPPNSGDCGITLGVVAHENQDRKIDATYCGYEILDYGYYDSSFYRHDVTNQEIAKILFEQKKIIGYIHGNSECGPRALGNRSILCYPDIANLKNKLNSEIKFREWYRPFGAVTKLENLEKYFYKACESPFMNFCPILKEQYRWPSITHVDNTCRIQTVTRLQHPDLYDILTQIENLGGEGILLNTSFNIKGKPILTTMRDAFEVLEQTKLNGFVHNNLYYTREV